MICRVPSPGLSHLRVSADARQVHAPGAVLDEEQHIQAPQQHGVDVEEVRSEDRRGLPGQERPPGIAGPVPCQNSRTVSELVFLQSLGCSAVLADQAMDDLPARDPGGHIDRLPGLVQRRSLFPRLVGPMMVVVLCELGQSPPEVSFTVDQQVVKALAPQRSHTPLRKRVRPG
jgi:hypothetical protein